MQDQMTIGAILDSTREFDGATYEPELDKARLTSQLERVKTLMLDSQWRTLTEIQSP